MRRLLITTFLHLWLVPFVAFTIVYVASSIAPLLAIVARRSGSRPSLAVVNLCLSLSRLQYVRRVGTLHDSIVGLDVN